MYDLGGAEQHCQTHFVNKLFQPSLMFVSRVMKTSEKQVIVGKEKQRKKLKFITEDDFVFAQEHYNYLNLI